jgi:DNA helicase-2/ATP-dependent DNA helicase PcrA
MSVPQSEIDRSNRIARAVDSHIRGLESRSNYAQLQVVRSVRDEMYFGAVEFTRDGRDEFYLVGKHHFDGAEPVIVSWQSPIGGLIYQRLGEACLSLPGELNGDPWEDKEVDLWRKRSYTFHGRQLVAFSYEGAPLSEAGARAVSWNDRLLEALSNHASRFMRDMVATIQSEQNAAIRDDHPVLVVQGVAGSGKTEVALHRVSYLLYAHRDELTEGQILVVSPSRGLAEYMSRVLPSLGNEGVPQWTVDELAQEWLSALGVHGETIETSQQQLERICGGLPRPVRLSFEWKTSPAFARKLADWNLADWMSEEMGDRPIRSLRPAEVRDMAIRAYKGFLASQSRSNEFIPTSWDGLSRVDLWPLLYLSEKISARAGIRFQGDPENGLAFQSFKHIVIDEMQDLCSTQFLFLRECMAARQCRWTLLGDGNQVVNALLPDIEETLGFAFPGRHRIVLDTCYRSSKEIMEYAAKLVPCDDVLFADRHSPPPEEREFPSEEEMIGEIESRIAEAAERFKDDGFLAIVCKTDREVETLAERLSRDGYRVPVLGRTPLPDSGVVIASVRVAKGRDFDEVVIPRAKNLCSDESLDRRLLYVACTRAMHRLALLSVEAPGTDRIPDDVFARPSSFRQCPTCRKWVSTRNSAHVHASAGQAPLPPPPSPEEPPASPRVGGIPARMDTIQNSDNAYAGYHVYRDNGRFGSLPAADRFDDESRP